MMRYAMVAGEPSGDLLASHVLAALRAHDTQAVFGGIGGPRMRAQGFDAWWNAERLAVNGFAAVLPRLPELLWMRGALRRRILRERPSAFVGIDAPDFNLGLERALRAHGIPTVHFVSPSIWAWRRERLAGIASAVDHMLCVFPFEPDLYAGTRVRATYVGHPLAEVIPVHPDAAAARAALGLTKNARVIAVLPGSRVGEVHQIAPAFLAAATLLQQREGARIVIPVAQPGVNAALRAAAPAELDALWLDGQSHLAIEACDAALVASGTATLECALFKRPMVIGYRLPALSWRMMKKRSYLPWVGLPNILAGSAVVPELLQDACTATALADAVAGLLDDTPRCDALRARFDALHAALLRPTARLCAEAIAEAAQARR